MEKQYVITKDLRDGILNYLQARPYREVAQAIHQLIDLPEFVQQEPKQPEE